MSIRHQIRHRLRRTTLSVGIVLIILLATSCSVESNPESESESYVPTLVTASDIDTIYNAIQLIDPELEVDRDVLALSAVREMSRASRMEVLKAEIPGKVEIECSPEDGQIYRYWNKASRSRDPVYPFRQPMSESQAVDLAKSRFEDFGVPIQDIVTRLFGSGRSQGGDTSEWYIRDRLKYSGYPCEGKIAAIRIHGDSGELISYRYIPVIAPETLDAQIRAVDAIKTANKYRRRVDSEIHLDESSDATIEIVHPPDKQLDIHKLGGGSDRQPYTRLCWVVHYESTDHHVADGKIYVDAETGNVRGSLF